MRIKLLITLFAISLISTAQIVDLSKSTWKFHKQNDSIWLTASVPGTVHTDLLENKKIEDPYFRTNEKDLQWIEKENWEYKTVFIANEKLLSNEIIELVFEGLDTYADVYLNDTKVISANNMFLEWTVDVKKILKNGNNQLRILFHSPINAVMTQFDNLGYTIPVSNNDVSEKRVSVFSRKAGYHYGWDWGPRFVTSGVWRPVYLNAWNKIAVRDLFVKQLSIIDNKANIETQLSISSTTKGVKNLQIFVDDNITPIVNEEVLVRVGDNTINNRFVMNNIELWWPNGMGAQRQYKFKAVLVDGDNQYSSKEVKRGLRIIEVVQENNKLGQSFYFKVNGKKVFMKGANYIPQDNFLTRVTKERYENLINTAVESNMNMLRVWGGGIYENDLFYDLCDEKGILIWQDFMFACAMYPPFSDLKNSIYDEAIYNIKRLRNHSSIALWCGNNEGTIFINSKFWGHSKPNWRTKADSAIVFDTYNDIFLKILPAALKRCDEDKFYWASSPNGINYSMKYIKDNISGDSHYWGVWWGKHPFEKFNSNLAPFMSEYGFQSFPELETVKQYAIPEDYNIESAVMKAHQKSTIGNKTITNYMKDMFNIPSKFEDFLYVGQLLQSEGIRTAIEAHRRNKPFCMGTLYWQIDDCWPVASWSSVDYYGRWKAQQYMVKKAYQPYMLSSLKQGDSIKVYVVSDKYNPTLATLNTTLLDFSGKIIKKETSKITLPENSSTVQFVLNEKEWLSGVDRKSVVLKVQLLSQDNELAENNYFFEQPKDLNLPKIPGIKIKQLDASRIEISTQKLARFVWLNHPKVINAFSDNYFDLLPGQSKVLTVKSPFRMKNIQVKTLVDAK